jgi:hypothetical protein
MSADLGPGGEEDRRSRAVPTGMEGPGRAPADGIGPHGGPYEDFHHPPAPRAKGGRIGEFLFA